MNGTDFQGMLDKLRDELREDSHRDWDAHRRQSDGKWEDIKEHISLKIQSLPCKESDVKIEQNTKDIGDFKRRGWGMFCGALAIVLSGIGYILTKVWDVVSK